MNLKENILRIKQMMLISETSYREFDDIENSIWRKFVKEGQYHKAIDYMLDYLHNNESELEGWQIGGILWHIGQIYAIDNDYDNAIKFMGMKPVENSIEPNYQMGTIAFLKKDFDLLKQYYENLVEYDPTGGSGRNILKRFLDNFDLSYKKAY